ncbi:DUF3017 domain-containing protein [Corynebacterium choanae]|uniref:DUF3017 domain-containing protein n=1 Tax=Corynebacterium choanae TaxID=1862358 RepID=A0A3G6J8V1_9CORY|nr:DUF3017 domain-containing protein [Corynebacterium choanae]AZA14222.1 hypothetical protein CCHOA_09195 [Corynebacterium choanae]
MVDEQPAQQHCSPGVAKTSRTSPGERAARGRSSVKLNGKTVVKAAPAAASGRKAVALPVACSPVLQRLLVGGLLVGLVTAVFFVLTDHWRRATFTLGLSMLWLAWLHCTVSRTRLGILAIRTPKKDAMFCALTGGLLAYLALSVDSLGS